MLMQKLEDLLVQCWEEIYDEVLTKAAFDCAEVCWNVQFKRQEAALDV